MLPERATGGASDRASGPWPFLSWLGGDAPLGDIALEHIERGHEPLVGALLDLSGRPVGDLRQRRRADAGRLDERLPLLRRPRAVTLPLARAELPAERGEPRRD